MFTPDYQIDISTVEISLFLLFMFDLFLIKDHSAHFNDVFKDLNKEFGTPMFGFNSNNYYIKTHDKLMSLIKSKFIKQLAILKFLPQVMIFIYTQVKVTDLMF